ncbi:MAG: TIR domain-containing protein [Hyphomonas sp.]
MIIIGINNAGQNLIQFASDLVNRIDVIEFEQNPDEKIFELIDKGCTALNVKFNHPEDIVQFSHGSFYLCQMLCFELCLSQNVQSSSGSSVEVSTSIEKVRSDVWRRLDKSFGEPCKQFCRGNRFRRGGRAPYFHILRSLAQSGDWLLKIKDYERQNPNMRNSINEVITKGHLTNLISEDETLPKLLHYDPSSQTLIVEDPQFVFYIQNLSWKTFAEELGFTNVEVERRYDFALSFAGEDRDIAAAIFDELLSRQYEVFYDKNEQSRMLANDVETYLDPIYRSEARFVVCVLGPQYPNRVWTRFEQKAFRERIGSGEVIPVLVDDTRPDSFSELDKIGHHVVRRTSLRNDVETLCELLDRKIQDPPTPTTK